MCERESERQVSGARARVQTIRRAECSLRLSYNLAQLVCAKSGRDDVNAIHGAVVMRTPYRSLAMDTLLHVVC